MCSCGPKRRQKDEVLCSGTHATSSLDLFQHLPHLVNNPRRFQPLVPHHHAHEVVRQNLIGVNDIVRPTAEWTLQQFRETLPGDHAYRFVLHDRDSIFSQELDKAVAKLGVRVLRTPVRAPTANAFCERLGGSLRRECLDFLIPLNERHLRMIVKEWGIHYNRGRPHSSLGPGIPEPSQESVPASDHRHKLPAGYRVGKTPVLGGLHHEYRLVKEAA